MFAKKDQKSGLFQPEKQLKMRKNIIRGNKMKEEYDFSKGERGKFYRPDAKLNLPIYLDDEVFAFIEDIASKKGTDFSSVANQLLRSNMQLAEAIK